MSGSSAIDPRFIVTRSPTGSGNSIVDARTGEAGTAQEFPDLLAFNGSTAATGGGGAPTSGKASEPALKQSVAKQAGGKKGTKGGAQPASGAGGDSDKIAERERKQAEAAAKKAERKRTAEAAAKKKRELEASKAKAVVEVTFDQVPAGEKKGETWLVTE